MASARRRMLVANLDCERDFALAAGMSPRSLPEPVLHTISAAGVLLAVLGEPGDTLWTPRPVAPGRLADRLLETGVTLVSGALEEQLEGDHTIVPWGWTAALCALSSSAPPAPSVLEINHRAFAHKLSARLGWTIDSSELQDSFEQFAATMAHWPHPRPWVLKAPMSASGRDRIRRQGAPDQEAKARARKLFRRYHCMLFEPWLDRESDFGVTGIVGKSSPCNRPHSLSVDGNGVFRAATVGESAVPAAIADKLVSAWHAVADAVAETGYSGPLGIDAFTYLDEGGHTQLRPMCEINGRMSFGLIANRFAQTLAGDQELCLHLSRGGSIPDGVTPLLWPDDGDPTCAWLEFRPLR